MTLKPQICLVLLPPVCVSSLLGFFAFSLRIALFISTGTVVIAVDFLMRCTVGYVLLHTRLCVMLRNTVMVDLSISKKCCL